MWQIIIVLLLLLVLFLFVMVFALAKINSGDRKREIRAGSVYSRR